MHHIHISTFALFIIMMFTLGIAALVVAFFKDARRERQYLAERKLNAAMVDHAERGIHQPSVFREGRWAPSTGYAPAPPVHAAPVYYGADPTTSLLTGMLVGEALSSHHHDTTVIHEGSGSSYVDSSPSYDSGISYSDTSTSFDSSSSSGGIDISW
jgi:hypothetical protein